MAVDYQSLAVKGVQALSPYQPGKPIEELARELGLNPAEIVKLASNENPLGPSDKAMAAARKALEEMCLYPDGNGFDLDRKSTRLNSSHVRISYAVFCLKKKKNKELQQL